MKRRTRLRKLGLPADPEPTPTRPAVDYVALAHQLAEELGKRGLTTAWVTDIQVLDDCRRWGAAQVAECLWRVGAPPHAVRQELGIWP